MADEKATTPPTPPAAPPVEPKASAPAPVEAAADDQGAVHTPKYFQARFDPTDPPDEDPGPVYSY